MSWKHLGFWFFVAMFALSCSSREPSPSVVDAGSGSASPVDALLAHFTLDDTLRKVLARTNAGLEHEGGGGRKEGKSVEGLSVRAPAAPSPRARTRTTSAPRSPRQAAAEVASATAPQRVSSTPKAPHVAPRCAQTTHLATTRSSRGRMHQRRRRVRRLLRRHCHSPMRVSQRGPELRSRYLHGGDRVQVVLRWTRRLWSARGIGLRQVFLRSHRLQSLLRQGLGLRHAVSMRRCQTRLRPIGRVVRRGPYARIQGCSPHGLHPVQVQRNQRLPRFVRFAGRLRCVDGLHLRW